jgi:2'-5' RNA ligase
VYSLNVPVPPAVARLADDLHPHLVAFESVRERHSLVCKRFEIDDPHHLRERLRTALPPAPAFEARVTGVDTFDDPVRGPGPVVYLAVESPGLRTLHERLVAEFGAVSDDLEGAGYVPHVTLARGGSVADGHEVANLTVDPVTWTVSELRLHSRARRESVWTIPLPRPGG